MASVAAGSRLRIQGTVSSLIVRSLRAVDLQGGWQVPVLGDLAALQTAGLTGRTALVEFPTEAGPLRVTAELVLTQGGLSLRAPGLHAAALADQRRENVRGSIHLPLRGAVLSSSTTRSRGPAQEDASGPVLAGVTESVSAGGICADLARGSDLDVGAKIYLELGMPDGDLAPSVLAVVQREGSRVRARFIDISPLDRERLVRLVFARQRADLAQRDGDQEQR